MKREWILIWAGLLLAVYFVFSPVSFARGSGNFYALGFIKNPTGESLWFAGENEANCNQSLWYALVSPFRGVERVVLWSALSVLLLLIGFYATFLFSKKLLKNDKTALIATFLTFLIVDEFAVLSMPLPRHVVFFVLAPLGSLLFLESLEKKSKSRALIVGGLFSLMLAFHTLMAFFFAVSIACFVAGQIVASALKKSNTDWKTGLAHGAIVATLGIGLSLPVILQSLTAAIGGITHPVYGDWARWGLDLFGVWMADLSLIFYSKTVIVKFLVMLGLGLVAGLHFWKQKNEAYIFLTSNLLVSFLFLFTPLGAIVARLVTPGIFVEQWLWHTAPFSILAAAGISSIHERTKATLKSQPIQKGVMAGLLVLALLPSIFFFHGLWKKPPQSAESFIGKEAIAYFVDKPDAIVLTDIETGYLLPFLTPAKVHATTLGYIVCPSNKTIERQKVSNAFFEDPTKDGLKSWNITHVLLNKRFWEESLDLHFMKDGWQYPESFGEAKAVFERNGYTARALDEETVVIEVT